MITAFVFARQAQAEFSIECYLKDTCNNQGWSGTSANPSTGAQVKINPSAVPTEAGFGIEGLFYKDSVDLAIVRGTGRVGAAISPSNSEETFFGPPGFENQNDFLERKIEATKYPNQKYTFAVAANLVNNKKSGLNAFSLKLGLMAKYNKLTGGVTPGGGLNGIIGPFTFGGSVYNDQTELNDQYTGADPRTRINYQVQTYNVGLFLNSLILDYSHLKLQVNNASDISEVTLLTASLFVKGFILTAAKRTEISARPAYNYDTYQLDYNLQKDFYFGGVQYTINKHLMLGAFYNYYLLREMSLSATVFF